jgi:hypothetical protein
VVAFNEGAALVLMRRGKTLVRMHTKYGARWFLGDGQIADDGAQRIVTRADVKPADADYSPTVLKATA